MKRLLIALGLMAAVNGATAQTQIPFSVGQVWTLKDAPVEARFMIMQIDTDRAGRIVHGAVSGFPPVVAQGEMVSVNAGHMPFDENAVRRSVDRLERTDAKVTPAFQAGYAQWTAAKGGVFTITVSEAVDVARKIAGAGNQ